MITTVAPVEPKPEERPTPAVDAGVAAPFTTADHLETRHLLGDLKNRAVSSTMMSVAGQGARFVLSLVSVIVLTRLLVPEDFGLVAMATSVIGFMYVFKDAGLSTPTVQHEAITHVQVSNLFWINVLLSGAASALLMAAAPAVAWFYNEPRVVDVTIALAAGFVLSGLTMQPRAILSRQMRFNVLSMVDVTTVAIGCAIGIAMALAGFRYWALVGQMIATDVAALVMIWSICRWRPTRPTRRSGTGPLLTLGANVATGGLMVSLSRVTDIVMLGRVFGSDAVGLYSRAMALLIRPLDQLLPALHSVFVPVLSRLQHDPVRYRRAFLRTYEAVALITFPVTAMMAGLAEPLTRLLFGPGWEGVTTIFASLAIAGLYLPLSNVTTWIFYSSGRGRDWLRASAGIAALTSLSFAAGLPFGPAGVALTFSIGGLVVVQPVLFYLVGRSGPVSTRDLWVGFARYLPLWVVVYGASRLAVALVAGLPPLSQLLVGVPIAMATGLACIGVVSPMRRSALDVLRAARGFRAGSGSGNGHLAGPGRLERQTNAS